MTKNLQAMEKRLASNSGNPKAVANAIRRVQKGATSLGASSPSRRK